MAVRSSRLLWFVGGLSCFVSLHLILQRTSSSYRTSTTALHVPELHVPDAVFGARRANATFVMLAQNKDLPGVMQSMHQVETRFNRRFGYPWIFLNDKPFTDEFMRMVSVQTDAPIEFGVIPTEDWHQPPWIDNKKAGETRKNMGLTGVPYGSSLSYRNMCRFNSGFFFKHELMQKYRYYWRVEPDVQYFCDVDHDPFLFMQDRNLTYGFTISLREYESTIRTLWNTVKEFIQEYPHLIEKENMMNFISNNGGNSYNLCHFWSNFEIADMDFWRGEAYTEFFNFLDRKGGFYYERWGDAPVHSIAVALLLKKEQTHFFDNIGYRHEPFEHCPTDDDVWMRERCSCNPKASFDTWSGSCLPKWKSLWDER